MRLKEHDRLEQRNFQMLCNVIDFIIDEGIVNPNRLVEYFNETSKEKYLKEMLRDEDDARSKYANLHPGGERSTITLGKLGKISGDSLVLDAGTGHGGPARVLAKNFKCKVIAIDLNPIRLLDAISRTKLLELDRFIMFKLENAYATSFPDEMFDVVFRQNSVYGGIESHFLKECHRLLKMSGTIAFQGVFKTIRLPKPEKEKLEDYTAKEYFALLGSLGFEVKEYETDESTRELREHYLQYRHLPEVNLIDKNKLLGFKLVARKIRG